MAAKFREQALERLSSPEQLDQTMRVARPTGWFAVLLIFALTVVALVWASVSRAPINVTGPGILIEPGGIRDVVSTTEGKVIEFNVEAGAYVGRGDFIARLAQPDLEQKIASARQALRQIRDQKATVLDLQTRGREARLSNARHLRDNLQQKIGFLQQRLSALDDRLRAQEELWEKRIIAKQTLVDSRILVTNTKDELARARADHQAIDLEVRAKDDRDTHEIMSLDLQIGSAQRTLAELEARMDESGHVRSTASGSVAEVKVAVGDVVTAGTPLLSLVPEGRDKAKDGLIAQVFIAAGEGKKVRPGMPVQVAPTTVKREEYGSIMGRVRNVSDIPVTTEGMMRVLKNQQLVRDLSHAGTPIRIEVELERADTPSGYRWSSSQGAKLSIDQGTLVTGFVTVRRVRLITMLFPMLEPLFADGDADDRSVRHAAG